MNSSPPKPEVILTNFFAEPTVLHVRITSRDIVDTIIQTIHPIWQSDLLSIGILKENSHIFQFRGHIYQVELGYVISHLYDLYVFCCLHSIIIHKTESSTFVIK